MQCSVIRVPRPVANRGRHPAACKGQKYHDDVKSVVKMLNVVKHSKVCIDSRGSLNG